LRECVETVRGSRPVVVFLDEKKGEPERASARERERERERDRETEGEMRER